MHISNRQQFVKRALKIIAFVLLAVLLLEGMSKVLMPRSNSGSGGMHNYRARGFYGEEKNSLDIAAIGNSDLASGFSPMELWKSHGIAGFACGEPNQTIDQSVRLLQEVLTCQKPKVVILETDTLFQENMVYLVFVFYQLAESRKREKEYSLIQQQSNIQLSVYRELSQKYADSVRIAHDAKKHVRALEDLVQSEQASQYRDSICAELNKLYPAFEHENPLFSVLINHALYRSERNGIRLDLRLHDADLSMLSDMDLTILFANLLDNAIEACTSLPAEKRKIQLILEQEMGFLIIHITNPFAELAPLPHHKYGSTKPGHMGVGLSNVRQTVEKYHGVFSVDTDAEVFAVAITIPVAQK